MVGLADEKTIDRAIAMVVQMQQAIEQENNLEESMGRDDDGLNR